MVGKQPAVLAPRLKDRPPAADRDAATMAEHVEIPPKRREARSAAPRRRLVILLGLGAAVAIAASLAIARALDSTSGSTSSTLSKSVPVSLGGLRTLGTALNRPIYWVGVKSGRQYELTEASNGRVWIRYLPTSEKIGEQTTPYLTVGTYPLSNAYAATEAVAKKKGSVEVAAPSGAVAFYTTTHPTNVYLAFRGSNYQIEVFDPSAAAARRFVSSGQISLIPGSHAAVASEPFTNADSVTPASLAQLSSRLKHAIYWLGPQDHVTYELTQTADGHIYVRYLPPATKLGSVTPYPTVATYPLANAFSVTQQAAKGANAVRIKVGGGGIAFYDKSSPQNVHLAFPGKNYQVEVFDPSPARAHQAVASGQVQPVH
jgi:hypothetical protein